MKSFGVIIGWVCAILWFASRTAGFSQGANPSSCSDMQPKHVRAHLQNPRNVYITIHTNKSSYLPGDKVPVTIRSTRDFMGFLIQARRVSNDQIAGTFAIIPSGSKLLTCFEKGDSVTHSDKSLKRNLSFVWIAPDHPIGDIKFLATVVQSYFVYWTRIESPVISGQQPNNETRNMLSKILPMALQSTTPANGTTLFEASNTDNIRVLENLTESPTSSVTESRQIVTWYHTHHTTLATKRPELTALILHYSSHEAHKQSLGERTKDDIPSSAPGLTLNYTKFMEDITPSSGRNTNTVPSVRLSTYSKTVELTQIPVEETTKQNLEGNSAVVSPHSLHSTSKELLLKHSGSQVAAANFLHHVEHTDSKAKTGGVYRNISPLVTLPVREGGIKVKGQDSSNKGHGLGASQLGILLGCSAALGMALATLLRYLHVHYCHKRTEVSFSQPESNIITVREGGELMHARKIRENSFVLVQAEYNVITPSILSGKK
ncbi:reelin domain-containing protein 1 [Protopterus annectens]|uniref:reelin domain-containing protein 1 n=1 Tax=Protopterus annectens TaxID=7888 RepID=UPI001CFA4511|nr:reelin domain-containing protein 1 [Protopterus annectens]